MKTEEAKATFINDLIADVRRDILKEVPKMPMTWGGVQLRIYIAEEFAKRNNFAIGRNEMRDYRNDCLVRNL